jgi:flagellar biosynthesis chaperone FliJ
MTNDRDKVYQDAVYEAAIQELADQLASNLRGATQDAAREALRRVEEELLSRSGQIDEATERITELLNGVGQDLRVKAAAVMTEGIESRVVPAMEAEGRKAFERTEVLVGSVRETVERAASAIAPLLGDVEKRLEEAGEKRNAGITQALLATGQALSEAIDNRADEHSSKASAWISALAAQIEGLTDGTADRLRDLAASAERQTDSVLKNINLSKTAFHEQLGNAEDRINREAKIAFTRIEGMIAASDDRLPKNFQLLNASLLNFQSDLAQKLREIDARQKEERALTTEALENILSDQKRRGGFVLLGQAGIAIIAIAVLFILLMHHR